MASNTKKRVPMDVDLQALIDTKFAEYEKYLRTPQDVHHYRRKRREYWESVNAALTGGTDTAITTAAEEGMDTDGRTADRGNGGN